VTEDSHTVSSNDREETEAPGATSGTSPGPITVSTDVASPAGRDASAGLVATEGVADPRAAVDASGSRPERSSRATSGDPSALERESEIAADYLEELLDIADLDGDIDMDVERDRAAVSIVGGELSHLVGPEGKVLDALQELTRLAVHTVTGTRSRLMLDIGGYRAGRRAVLSQLGRTTAETVRASGESVRLDPMTPFERKIVHDAVAAAGLKSASEGEEPNRRVVVLPG
jgi:spoIIIJ-associated protein